MQNKQSLYADNCELGDAQRAPWLNLSGRGNVSEMSIIDRVKGYSVAWPTIRHIIPNMWRELHLPVYDPLLDLDLVLG
jgi:hypothetical protein